MVTVTEIAHSLGLLTIPDGILLRPQDAMDLAPDKVASSAKSPSCFSTVANTFGTLRMRANDVTTPARSRSMPAADARDLYGRDLALIRPDQYVAWRGDGPPSDPDRLIERLVGAG